MKDSNAEYPSWVRPCFSNRTQYVLYVLYGWFVQWEVSGHTAGSRIYWKQDVVSLCISHLFFYRFFWVRVVQSYSNTDIATAI